MSRGRIGEPSGGVGGAPGAELGGLLPASADQGLYSISVVTELTGLGPHTLRGYERAGLLSPGRTEGGTRRYSDNDLARLRRIATLTGEGVNLAGIGRILQMETELAELRSEIDRLRGVQDTVQGLRPTTP